MTSSYYQSTQDGKYWYWNIADKMSKKLFETMIRAKTLNQSDITYSANTTLTDDVVGKDITINSGVTLTTKVTTSQTQGGPTIILARKLTIIGTLSADGNGAAGAGAAPGTTSGTVSNAPSPANSYGGYWGTGGSYGTLQKGGGAAVPATPGAGAYTTSATARMPIDLWGNDIFNMVSRIGGGSAGGVNVSNCGGDGNSSGQSGSGGYGGGAIWIFCETLNLTGTITAQGLAAGASGAGVSTSNNYGGLGSGGGCGGVVFIVAKTLSGTGTINVTGGAGGNGGACSAGGSNSGNGGNAGSGATGGLVIFTIPTGGSNPYTIVKGPGAAGSGGIGGASGTNGAAGSVGADNGATITITYDNT